MKLFHKYAVAVSVLIMVFVFSLFPIEVFADGEETTLTKTQQLKQIFTTADLTGATISELTDAIESGRLTAEELVQMYLDRINVYDKPLGLNSIITVSDTALQEAREIDRRRANGENVGLLGGIPYVVKDNIDVKNMATSAGSVALKNSVAPDDSNVVARLRAEGAIMIAKTNMSEFAFEGAYSRSILGGICRNVYDTARTPAGSSGGVGVAVAADFAVFGIGTDTNSSLRRPASFSNLYALRPSFGLVGRDGVLPLNSDRDVVGPMCRSTADLALVMDIISGTDKNDYAAVTADKLVSKDGYSSHVDKNGLEGKTIGVLANSYGYYVDGYGGFLGSGAIELSDIAKPLLKSSLKKLEDSGAKITDISKLLPEPTIRALTSDTYYETFEYDLVTYLSTLGRNAPCKNLFDIRKTGFNKGYGVYLQPAFITDIKSASNPREYSEWKTVHSNMLKMRTEVSDILKKNGIDAVIYISQTDVCDYEERSYNCDNDALYINRFGPVGGMPEIMIPMGLTAPDKDSGYEYPLPLGMSVFTSYGSDAVLIEIASAFEAAGDGWKPPSTVPPLKSDALVSFYNDLVSECRSLDYSSYEQSKADMLKAELRNIQRVDINDTAALYSATEKLCIVFDAVVALDDKTNSEAGDLDNSDFAGESGNSDNESAIQVIVKPNDSIPSQTENGQNFILPPAAVPIAIASAISGIGVIVIVCIMLRKHNGR